MMYFVVFSANNLKSAQIWLLKYYNSCLVASKPSQSYPVRYVDTFASDNRLPSDLLQSQLTVLSAVYLLCKSRCERFLCTAEQTCGESRNVTMRRDTTETLLSETGRKEGKDRRLARSRK